MNPPRARSWGSGAVRAWRGGVLALAIGGALAPPARALDEPLIGERSATAASGVVIPLGHAQFEGGGRLSVNRDAKTLSGPEFRLRLGLLPRIELRLGIPDYERTSSNGGAHGRLADTYVSVKAQLRPADSRISVALIPGFKAPADKSERGDAAPEIVAAVSTESESGFSLRGNLGREWRQRARRGPDALTGALSVSRELRYRLSTFVEWSAEIPDRGPSLHVLHHGYALAVSSDGAVDVQLGLGLSEVAPDFFIGAGFVVRH